MKNEELLSDFKDLFTYKDGKIYSLRGGEGIRVVRIEVVDGYFGTSLLFIHPHIMDLFNYGIMLLEDTRDSQIFDYDDFKNAFVVKYFGS